MDAGDRSRLNDLHKSARRLLRDGVLDLALERCVGLLAQVDAPAPLYDEWVATTLKVLQAYRSSLHSTSVSGSAAPVSLTAPQIARLAAACQLYQGSPEDLLAAADLLAQIDPDAVERAFVLFALGTAPTPPAPSPKDSARLGSTATATLHTSRGRMEACTTAARLFEAQGRLARAAHVYATCWMADDAHRCYLRLLSARGGAPAPGPYEQALLHFQLASMLGILHDADGDLLMDMRPRQESENQHHAIAAMGLLEQQADAYEAADQPERAVDVYCIYIALGRALGSFENMAEGFIGCLRLLKRERLIGPTLRCYEDFLTCCGERDEPLLAAQVAREAAEFLDRCGLPGGDSYRVRAAAYYRDAAARPDDEPSRRESALIQAVSLYSDLGDPAQTRAALAALADLPLRSARPPAASAASAGATASPATRAAAARRARYKALADRYPAPPPPDAATGNTSAAHTAAAPPAPPALGDRAGDLPVWNLDLYEWEDAGDASTVAYALLADRKRPLLTRRQALRVALLCGITPPIFFNESKGGWRTQLIDALTGLRCYEALRPLEVIFDAASPLAPTSPAPTAPTSVANRWLRDPDRFRYDPQLYSPQGLAALRASIITGLPRLSYRRALGLILRGLVDPDLSVYAASLEALTHTRFPASVSMLCRLYRDFKAPTGILQPAGSPVDIRRAALVALARSLDPRAYEVLIDVCRRDPEPLRSDALRHLRHALATDANVVRPLLARATTVVADPATAALRALLFE